MFSLFAATWVIAAVMSLTEMESWAMRTSLIIVLLSISASIVSAQESPVDSPQLAFDSYKSASENNDWNSLYAAISPGWRDYMIFESVFAMGMNAPNKEGDAIIAKYVDQAKLEKLYAGFKQRPTPDETIKMYSQAIQNKRGMFLECMRHFEKKEKDQSDATKPKFGQLAGLVVNGNVATAKSSLTTTVISYSRIEGDSKDIRQEQEITTDIPVYFIKSDGKWLCSTPAESRNYNAQDTKK